MRTVVLRVVALAVLLLLVLAAVLTLQTMRRLPDTLIYLIESDTAFRLEAVGRRSSAESPEEQAQAAISELAGGPTEGERERGLSSSIPEETEVRGVRFEDGILQVDLSEEFELGGGSAEMQARLYQLFYTLTQPAAVEGVVLLIEGQVVDVFGGEGVLVESPWLRERHPGLPVW
jgi:spore germination protein GerM